ncbi:MAG: glycosyltransferase family 4 protein [Methylacidiphilales bacterium]|nr:glycosyltransferase family 4 protein [Candidatus Methylacidiphilales bacterium]
MLFDLALALKEKIPDLRLRIVADSQTRSHDGLDNLSKAGIEFDYTPFVSPDRISAVFASARMLILPSIHEPWGLVCNEAMQCGTPCAVSPHTGAADDLVVNGVSGLVLDLDVERWASAIAAILADRAHWEAMSHAAVATAAKFSLESSANEYIHGLTSSTQAHLPGTKTTIARHITKNTAEIEK